MTKEEALKMALDALGKVYDNVSFYDEMREAMTAIKEALAEPDEDEIIIQYHEATIKRLEKRIDELMAQPEKEPVAWAYVNSDDECEQIEYCTESPMREFMPLYAAAPKRQPLTDEQAKNLLQIGPVYAPDGVVTRTPLAYRKELLETALWALRKGETSHGIGANHE